jgi:hypothetical protein
MKLMRLFTRVEQIPKRFENPVDDSLMLRIEEQRERLRLRGVEVTPLLRVRDKATAVATNHDSGRARARQSY